MCFDNRFLRELPGDPETGSRLREVRGAAYSRVEPTPVPAPSCLAVSREMLEALGFAEEDARSAQFAEVFAGNAQLEGMEAWAANYGGHQFGHWAGQLGDGRVIGLGEVIARDGRRWELQLKGAGPTPYSRMADGRAVLRSSVREFLCSEAMHHLGVPTTRALSLVATGESVVRDLFYDGHPEAEPGAIVCRVAPSFIRFGTFELPSARGEIDLLRRLVDFCIDRDFPHLRGQGETLRGDWFAEVCERTARMIAHWMRVGFVHGVMNTDNLSILGLTLDYGPYGWIDNFDPDWTPNTTDRGQRRYRFGNQPAVAHWNLACLAQALAPLFESVEPLQEGIARYAETYAEQARQDAGAKLGLEHWEETDADLVTDLHALLARAEIDMTLFYRALSQRGGAGVTLADLMPAFYDDAKRESAEPELGDWLQRYRQRLAHDPQSVELRRERMCAVNPCFVLRNWLAQEAIDRAHAGDASGIHTLLDVLRNPYAEQPGREHYAARRPDWARDRPGCSMLSCSS